ncbi:MAG: hypothetical protein IKG66_08670, partial [Lachnospiraceae bacterium]|nr:hypothetical protein [Lachnospiraceae bacterium]
YEDLYKIDDFGSFFELTADMSFPPGGWSAITLGGGRSILLSYVDLFNFWLIYWVFRPSGATRFCLSLANGLSCEDLHLHFHSNAILAFR